MNFVALFLLAFASCAPSSKNAPPIFFTNVGSAQNVDFVVASEYKYIDYGFFIKDIPPHDGKIVNSEAQHVFFSDIKQKEDGQKKVLIVHGNDAALQVQEDISLGEMKNIIAVVFIGQSLHVPLSIPSLSIGTEFLAFGFALDRFKLNSDIHKFILIKGSLEDLASPSLKDLLAGFLVEFLVKQKVLTLNLPNYINLLEKYEISTDAYCKPILELLFLESHPYLLPPCSDYSDGNPLHVKEPCFVGNKWTEYGQLFMSGVLKDELDLMESISIDVKREFTEMWVGRKEIRAGTDKIGNIFLAHHTRFKSRNEIHATWVHFPTHLPKVFYENEKEVVIESVSENLYNPTAYTQMYRGLPKKGAKYCEGMISSFEIQAKLASRQLTLKTLGFNVPLLEADQAVVGRLKESFCKKINNMAVSVVELILRNLSKIFNEGEFHVSLEEAFKRYLINGRQLYAGEDFFPIINGFEWIYMSPLKYIDHGNSSVEVRSTPELTDTEFFIKQAAGFHYCKLLSPAYVLEWIIRESIKP